MNEQSKNKSILDFLNEDSWIKGSLSLNEKNGAVGYDSSDVCKWCIVGAILKAHGAACCNEITNKFYSNNGLSLSAWNDMPTTTFEQVKLLALRLDL